MFHLKLWIEAIEKLILHHKKNNCQSELLKDGAGPFGELQFSASRQRWTRRGELASGDTVEGVQVSGVLGLRGSHNLTGPSPPV